MEEVQCHELWIARSMWLKHAYAHGVLEAYQTNVAKIQISLLLLSWHRRLAEFVFAKHTNYNIE
jgi:hypothetical protein